MPASSFLAVLALTIAIELIVAYWLGYRNKYQVATIILMNLVTNPVLSLVLWLNSQYCLVDAKYLVAVMEVSVVFGEAAMLAFVLGLRPKKTLSDSFLLNLASLSFGGLVFAICLRVGL